MQKGIVCFWLFVSASIVISSRQGRADASEWILDGDGSWNVGANWSGGIPDNDSASALLGTAITQNREVHISDSADHKITLSQLLFDGHYGYELLAGIGESMTLGGSPAAEIRLPGIHGNARHSIESDIELASNLRLRNDSAGALLFDGGRFTGINRTITKTGYGTVMFPFSTTSQLAGTTTWQLDQGALVYPGSRLSTSAFLNFNGGKFVMQRAVNGIAAFSIGAKGGTIEMMEGGGMSISTANMLSGSGLLRKEGLGAIAFSINAQPGFTGRLEVRGGDVNASDASQQLANATGFTIQGKSGIFAGQLRLSAANLANVPISVGAGGILVAPSGSGVGLASLTRGGNLALASGAVIAQTANGGNASVQGLQPTQDLFFGIGATHSVTALTIGAGTPWMGLSGIQQSDVTLNSSGSGVITANSDFTIQHYNRELRLNNTSISSNGARRVVTIAAPTANSMSQGVADRVLTAGTADEGVVVNGNASFGGVSKFVVTPGAVFEMNVAGALGMGATQAPILEVQGGGRFIKGTVTAPSVPDTLGTGVNAATVRLIGPSRITLGKPLDPLVAVGGKFVVESTLPSSIGLTNAASGTNNLGIDSMLLAMPGASVMMSGAVEGATTFAGPTATIGVSRGGVMELRGGLHGSGVLTKGYIGKLTINGAASTFGGPASQIRIDAGIVELSNQNFDVEPSGPTVLIGSSTRWLSAGVYSLPTNVDAGAKLDPASTGVLAIRTNNSSLSGVNKSSAYIGADGVRTLAVNHLAPGSGNTFRLGGGVNSPVLNVAGVDALSGNNDLVVGMPGSAYLNPITNGVGTVVLQASNSYSGRTTVNLHSTLMVDAAQGIGGGSGAGQVDIDGALIIRGLGSLGPTDTITLNYGSQLTIDDTAVRNPNRVPDTTPIVLRGGTILYTTSSDPESLSSETIGQAGAGVTLMEGSSLIQVQMTPAVRGILSIGQLSRQAGATLREIGIPPRVVVGNGDQLEANGIIPWIGEGFSSSTPAGLIFYPGPFAPQIDAATANENVQTTSSVDLLTANRTISSLFLNGDVDTGGHVLNVGTVPIGGLASGPIYLNNGKNIGTGANPGYLTAGQAAFAPNSAAPGELIVYPAYTSTIASAIIDNAGPNGIFGDSDDLPVTLTKAESGTLNLTSANNRYSGGTIINEGVLAATFELPGNVMLHHGQLVLSSATANASMVAGDITVSNSLAASESPWPMLRGSYTGPADPANPRPEVVVHGLTVTPGSILNLKGDIAIVGEADLRGAQIVGNLNNAIVGVSSVAFRGDYVDDARTVMRLRDAPDYRNTFRFQSGAEVDVHATFADNPAISAERDTTVNFFGALTQRRNTSPPNHFLVAAATGGRLRIMPGAIVDAANGWEGNGYDCGLVELQGDSAGTIEMMEGFDLIQVEGTNNLADLGAYQLVFNDPVTLVTNHTDNLPNCDPSVTSKLPPNVFLGSINIRADGARWVVQSNPQFYNQKLDVAADARIVTNAPLTLTADSALGMGDADNITLSSSQAGLRVGTRSGSIEKLGAGDLSVLGRLYVANYSKITVAEGRLVLSNRTAEGYGQMDVEVRAGAILAGGSVDGVAGLIPGTVTVQPGGTIDPGNSPYGVLSVIGDHPDVNLFAASVFHADLGGVTPGVLHDQIRLQGQLWLGDDAGRPILDPQLAYAPNIGDLFFIIRNDSTLSAAGLFRTELGAVLNQGDIFSVVSGFDGGTYQVQISYRGDVVGAQFDLPSGNDVTLKVVAVPELSSCLLLIAGSIAALGVRRFRCC